jgi:methylmalonyl-CoA mutase N-terminal domain/subunit
MTRKAQSRPAALPLSDFEAARGAWRADFRQSIPDERNPRNRSGIEIQPIYTPQDWDGTGYMQDLGFPGQVPLTRGIYPTMHRGRRWSQRQLIGLSTPEDYRERVKVLVDAGVNAASLTPSNSVFRGLDADEVDPALLGTCGVVVNTVEDMETCLSAVPLGRFSKALNDPSPFSLMGLMLAVAKKRNVPWSALSGTSNQSDCISHYVANHMFFRLELNGARRVLTDHIAFCNEHVPQWNPLSVVGQHMQQAGATPAEAMAFTLSSAIQYTEDAIARGLDPETFLPRLTYFFDISISFFEEVAKFRAGRRIWQKVVRERWGVENPRAWRFKFHAQTSGVDLTREQPLNNIARVSVQAMAGIFGGLQSLHTDSFDEVLSSPTERGARIALATHHILQDEARLTDVIDPLGGSYYVEALTNQMQEKIEAVMKTVEEAGGMGRAVENGLVQRMIGQSALDRESRLASGEDAIVGVTRYRLSDNDDTPREPLPRPAARKMKTYLKRLKAYKAERNQTEMRRGLDALARAANTPKANVMAAVVDAAGAGVTHGEICACLRRELGDGRPLIVA